MGRGLSPLQRWILQEAATRQQLYTVDICQGFFGWQPCRDVWRDGKGLTICPTLLYFSRQQIGAREYNRVRVTISRSCGRLWKRGFIKGPYAPVEITTKGRQWLSANFVAG
jgi:hypothetical protein